jgi:hypothetical protein
LELFIMHGMGGFEERGRKRGYEGRGNLNNV